MKKEMQLFAGRFILSAAMASSLLGIGLAQDDEKLTTALSTDKPPVIDGKLDDACWANAEETGGFLIFPPDFDPAPVKTTFKTVYDKDNIYFAIWCEEPEPGAMVRKERKHDDFFAGDSIEIYLDPGKTTTSYYQLIASLEGPFYDAKGVDTRWDCDWKAKGLMGDKCWTLEVQIPLASMGSAAVIKEGDMWGLNLCRNRHDYIAKASAWAPVGNNFHSPGSFGALLFGSYKGWYEKTFLARLEAHKKLIAESSAKLAGNPKLAQAAETVNAKAEELQKKVASDPNALKDKKAFSKVLSEAQRIMAACDELKTAVEASK